MFWLFADTVQVTAGGTTIGLQYNPPDDYGCHQREPSTGASASSSRSRPSPACRSGENHQGGRGGGAGKGSTEYSRFCFDRVLADRARRTMDPERLAVMKAQYLDAGVNHSPVCGSHWTPGQKEDEATDTLQFRVGHLTFTILPRSTNNIYQLLGKVLREEYRAKREEAAGVEPDIRAYLPPGRYDERLPVLSTYLGHRGPVSTYWYYADSRVIPMPAPSCA